MLALSARKRHPILPSGVGSSNTVSRALGLIEAGALDDANVETLAARLGIGERQLRRLFRQHLGASPISIAQTRRILLAKQLIHDTRLPMTEVALAAGFGSVRRFNEIFQQLYRRPPKTLRRRAVSEAAGRHDGLGCGQAWLSAALRLGVPSWRSFARGQSQASRWCRATDMHARSRSAANAASLVVEPARATSSRQPFACQISGACRRSSHAFAVSSIWPPIRWQLARISARTRCWRRLSPLDRASGSWCVGRI